MKKNKAKEPILYRVIRPIVTVLFKLFYRPTIIGVENIPKTGRVVLAGNHTNNLDSMLLVSSTKRCIHFLAKIELFKGFIKNKFFTGAGLIPVNRKVKDGTALKKAIEFLNDDFMIGIFPEGTINRTDDIIMKFKMGAVKMASESNSEIVPFVIKGKYKIFKRSVRIVFLEPIKVKGIDLEEDNEKLMKIISDKLQDSEV